MPYVQTRYPQKQNRLQLQQLGTAHSDLASRQVLSGKRKKKYGRIETNHCPLALKISITDFMEIAMLIGVQLKRR
ncbi:hypothetical protein Lpp71_08917 [Lacticaseibacillus paracasei subsp. paracasei Lpp71]|uniref:Uncharacterized protein n=1 Tax=Lacticaseibacillus paracasei subsp. paracasei Lpp71 TaxID=1256207 RepID=A0A8E0ME11_LACPA|nr:hypothetical protein Lpp71_08917 [Lacticaseibacillus paracasei subsp. paracasei Lpp71]